MSDQEWMDELARLGSSVRPTGTVSGAVVESVRRRRRRRRGGVVLAVAAVVTVIASTSTFLAAGGKDPAVAPAPTALDSPSASTTPGGSAFTCPVDNQTFSDPPAIPDLAEQQALAEQIVRETRALSAWGVVHAEPTPLGVVALVVGLESVARDYLAERGVRLVHPFDPSGEQSGLDAHAQVEQVVGWQLDPLLREVRRATRGLTGNAGPAYWYEAGAIVVRWKAPAPPEVLALAGRRDDGTRVIVRETRYSSADIRAAQRKLEDFLRGHSLRGDWSTAYSCDDMSGMVVGMVPPVAERVTLQEEMAESVGLPVMVVPEEAPVPLGG